MSHFRPQAEQERPTDSFPFVARLKKSSQYYHQAEPGQWFEIQFRYRYDDMCINGNSNTYSFADVDIGVHMPDGAVRKLK